MSARPRVLVAAGGTAGHVVPALAVAEALRAEGAEVEFAGGERAEAELVPAAGYAFHRLAVAGIDRRNPLRALRAVALAALAVVRAVQLLRRLRPDAVIGGGGYVAGPVGLAAVLLRKPLFLTEADSHLGLTNRLLARFARRVFLAFPLAGRTGDRYRVTGRPIPAVASGDRSIARRRFGVPPGELCLLVFGGSLGARSLNEAAVEAFASDTPFWVLHVSGRRDYQDLSERVGERAKYRLEPYVEPFADALAAADFVAARAGGSVFELAAAGLPAVLVPYPHATADHQTANARWMVDGGAAVLVPDAELDPARLHDEALRLARDGDLRARMSDAARSLARPDAAAVIASEVLAGNGD